MRHLNKKGRLNRNISHRKALLKNMTISLFRYQRIETTLAKAKALKSFAEPLITMAKKEPGSVSAKRRAFKKLCDKDIVKVLFRDLAPLYKDIPGGYTRIIPLGARKGDGAKKVILELTKKTLSDDELPGKGKPKESKKASRGKAGSKSRAPRSKGPGAKKKTADEEKAEKSADTTSAPDIDVVKKEEHFVEDVKKEKAKKEQKKISSKGIFKRFRRKSIG